MKLPFKVMDADGHIAEDQAKLIATVRPVVAKVLAGDPKVNEAFKKLTAFAKANE